MGDIGSFTSLVNMRDNGLHLAHNIATISYKQSFNKTFSISKKSKVPNLTMY